MYKDDFSVVFLNLDITNGGKDLDALKEMLKMPIVYS